jgi:hypothetical protein
MRKFLLIASCVILISINSQAQLDTIPNASFENWYYTPFWTIEAAGWHTNNSSTATWNVMPDSISHTGLLGLKLQYTSYRGTIWSGFPLSQHPLELDGFMKNGLGIGDTAFIRIHVYSSNVMVDSGYAQIYGGIGTTYLPFLVNISQNASATDSCVIMLEGGNYPGVISFDDLSFTFPTAVNENDKKEEWSIFPNPCHDILNVGISGIAAEDFNVVISDITGKKIMEEVFYGPQKRYELNVSFLPAGVYMLTTGYSKTSKNTLIIKQ